MLDKTVTLFVPTRCQRRPIGLHWFGKNEQSVFEISFDPQKMWQANAPLAPQPSPASSSYRHDCTNAWYEMLVSHSIAIGVGEVHSLCCPHWIITKTQI